MNFDSSKESVPDFIPVVILKNCDPEFSYILVELINMYLREFCFPDCWKSSLVVLVFKNIGERSTPEDYCPVSLLFVFSKVLEKLVSNSKLVDHLQKCDLFLFSSVVLGLLNQLQIF